MFRLLPRKVFTVVLGLLSLGTVLGTTAEAGISGNAYVITATSDAGTATYAIPAPVGDTFYWHWSTTERIELRDPSSGNLIAVLNPNNEGCSVSYQDDPVIGFAFAVQAGAAPTAFVFSSGSLAFAPIPVPQARASAAYTLTDFNGDGATLTPFAAKSYHATYNGGTPFADLIDPFGAAAFSSSTSNQSNPPGPGFLPIGGPASSMQVDIDFTLTPFDEASGTSVYVIQQTPVAVEPTTWSRIKALTR